MPATETSRFNASARLLLSTLTLLSGVTAVGAALRAPATSPRLRVGQTTPALVSRFRTRHAVRLRRHPDDTSGNWAGYAVTGSDFRDVVGSWQVPEVQAGDATHPTTYSSMWVGLDGDNSFSVEQCGTDQDWYDGQAHYEAWWEIYPSASVALDPSHYPVAAGDFINAEVKYVGDGQFAMSLSSSAGWMFTTTRTYRSAQRTSAEWIVEAPSSYRGILPLANFGSASMGGCDAAMGSDSLAPAGSWPAEDLEQITMASRGGVKVDTGPLVGLDGFSVSWHSY